MQQQFSFRLLPAEAASDTSLITYISAASGVAPAFISGFTIHKKSIDARGRQPWVNISLMAFINEPFQPVPYSPFPFPLLPLNAPEVVIIGAGPCGLFAALRLIESGIRPIVLERGKNVRDRRRDLALLNKHGVVDSNSNYCFGEGGAGTYSDGKLYTRSHKRGDITRVLRLFHQFGAAENILYEAHPHIGTNKLPAIITAMREQILASGGQVHFNQHVDSIAFSGKLISSVSTAAGDTFRGEAVLLATGHSARDIYTLLFQHHISVIPKSFALGVRVEHPQALIDSIQYHAPVRNAWLPPASYGLVQQVSNRGVFSFCMCPGGIIAPAATAPGELVVNGWSPSKRNNPFANSGIVAEVTAADINTFFALHPGKIPAGLETPIDKHPLAGMYFQQAVEQDAYLAGGGNLVAPAQRLTDFVKGISSASLPACSYQPGTAAVNLHDVLPRFIGKSLQEGFRAFGHKMRGYLSQEAILVATESRTSSPVRIPRDPVTLAHPAVANLYPAGEGGGYAGGIVSAAMDGEKSALAIALKINRHPA